MIEHGAISRISVILIVVFVLLGCGITTQATVPSIQTSEGQAPAVLLTLEPTIEQPTYTRAQIGSYISIWVTFDPEQWDAPKWIDGVNQSNEQVQQLINRSFTGCSLHDNLGHGVPENWSYGTYTKQIGNAVFQVEQWTDMTNNNPVLVVYQYPIGDLTNTTKRIELEPGDIPYDCINAAEQVIGLSTADITR